MILVGGDVVQAQALKRSSVGDYLIKLDNFVSQMERLEGSKNNLVKDPTPLLKPR